MRRRRKSRGGEGGGGEGGEGGGEEGGEEVLGEWEAEGGGVGVAGVGGG